MNESAIIRAIRFYEGDTHGDDPFWGDPKGYCTLNALLFPGIENECARFREGKRLNPAFLQDIPRLLDLYAALLNAFEPLAKGRSLTTTRVERLSDYLLLKELGRTVSFTSTSQDDFLSAYGDKQGLALMRFSIPEGTPCVVLAERLPEYRKADEAEALLPPDLPLLLEEIPLTDAQRRIVDLNGEPPVISARVKVHGAPRRTPRTAAFSGGADGPSAGVRVYAALNAGREPDRADAEVYARWKAALREWLLGPN